jgi:outer membrane protein OmpA-like peptidoglycan-associated protein
MVHDFTKPFAALAIVAALLSTSAHADDLTKAKGPYVSGQLGANWLDDTDVTDSGVAVGTYDWDTGWAALIAGGYMFGNGLRVEGELAHRRNEADSLAILGDSIDTDAKIRATSLMANVLYDIPLSPSVTPYVGAGLGFARLSLTDNLALGGGATGDTVFAYQGIAGIAINLTDGLDLLADYRYFNPNDAKSEGIEFDYKAHSLMIGLRYRFPEPEPVAEPTAPPPPPPAPAPPPRAEPKPAPAPAPALPRAYVVFFDWDRADIRPDARQVLESAMANAKKGGFSRVQLTGHADRSGPSRYNMGLSLRRANNVKAALVKMGMNANDIAVVAKGETEPLVSTADGVREPRNRRVEIVF